MQKNSYQEKFIILSGMFILYIVSDNNAMVWIGGVVCCHPAGSHHLVSLYYIYSISPLIQLITNLKTYTMTTEEWKEMMLAQLEKQKQEFIDEHIKTYGEYPECYAQEEELPK
jgi:predicted NodU family carbamoyl transferase